MDKGSRDRRKLGEGYTSLTVHILALQHASARNNTQAMHIAQNSYVYICVLS